MPLDRGYGGSKILKFKGISFMYDHFTNLIFSKLKIVMFQRKSNSKMYIARFSL